MTATTTGRRPAPHPRHITDRDAPPSSGASDRDPAERETAPEGSTLHPPPITTRYLEWARQVGGYFTPPALLTDPPPTVAQLADYAYRGGWTTQHGVLRTTGIWWHRAVGLPQTARCRYREWVWQRPGRTITALIVVKLLASTGPGNWVVQHVIYPGYRLAGWLFL